MAIITQKFRVGGMHCQGCETTIEQAVAQISGVRSVKADFVAGTATITFDPARTDPKQIVGAIDSQGYQCSPSPIGGRSKLRAFGRLLIALLALAAIVAILTLGDQLAERMHLPQFDRSMSYGLLFLIGFVTGFHCVGMCGAFVVGYTASAAVSGKRSLVFSHVLYGVGKTLSYALIGGLFGLLGSFIAFTPEMRGYAAIAAGIFLILFGLNMLDWFKSLRRIRSRVPAFLNRFVYGKTQHSKSPFLIGLLNGLMIACGPLQAMYIMAAGTGSFVEGAKLLFIFGLGTLPILLGFGVLTSLISAQATRGLLKASAFLVMALGLIMLNRGLIMSGSGYDFRTLAARATAYLEDLAKSGDVTESGHQTIRMDVNKRGFKPDTFVLKKGVPVKWIIEGKELNYCNHRIIVPSLGLEFDVVKGRQTIEFTPQQTGVIPWSCWMGMIPGSFIVQDNEDVRSEEQTGDEQMANPQ
ncbi:sulfite exporter TauE/SafE family protein [Methylocaldum szegediense]|uniref:urease accessory protein UreH domain-containing protein n=1 Tax=Methylocaldum szegediense TaxID=73780 RepID=UPI0003F621EA|nr:sulfite exporter TauE/SafE family protein [Methylocaldum szegediense]